MCPDDQKAYLLSVLACQEPEQAGRALKTLIEMHGFPSVYPRVFWNLEKNIQGVRHYIREFIRKPGRYIGHATDLVNRALELGLIETEYLDELAPLIEEQTAQAVTTVLEAQDRINRRWQLDRDYFYARIDLGAWLDLTGLVRKCGSAQLSRAVSSEDPLVNVFNAAAFLSKKMNVPQSVISRSADSLETVRGLYRTLLAKDRPDLFPASRLTFETFAAAEMVEWLLYPSELGEEPKSITLEKTIDGKDRGGKFHRYCLWRFFDHEENDYAGVSGPYDQASIENPTPDTVVSDETFSNFERWDSLTPEQHLEGVLATLESWRVGGALDD